MIILAFLACSAVIVISGTLLTLHADSIARQTGLGATWVGVTLLATATSLPELTIGVSAVTMANAPAIAVGDAVGSMIFNLAILAVIALFSYNKMQWRCGFDAHLPAASYGVLMIGIVAVLLAGARVPMIGHIAVISLILPVVYLVAVRSIFRVEQRMPAPDGEPAPERAAMPWRSIRLFLLNGAVILLAASLLPHLATRLAEQFNLTTSLVGTVFVAAVTSMPEVVVAVAALRMNAVSMAYANLLGSNLFDVVVLCVDDVFYLPGSLFASVSRSFGPTAAVAVCMAALVLLGVERARASGRIALAPAVAVLITYVAVIRWV